ncbi:MAG: hypothetical protein P8163_06155 [Candidatus Thiodiazotropha sp.]
MGVSSPDRAISSQQLESGRFGSAQNGALFQQRVLLGHGPTRGGFKLRASKLCPRL